MIVFLQNIIIHENNHSIQLETTPVVKGDELQEFDKDNSEAFVEHNNSINNKESNKYKEDTDHRAAF